MEKHPLPRTLLPFFWHFIKPYKWFLLGFILTGCYWSAANCMLPYVLKHIIDRVFELSDNRERVLDAVKYPALLYICLWTGMAIVMRLLDWIKLRFFPAIREDMTNSMYQYLSQHSHHYFQNNFAGTLSNKISDMTNGAVAVFTIADDAFAQMLGLLVAMVMMFIVHPVFAYIFSIWAVSFIMISLYFSKTVKVLSDDASRSGSELVGKIVDSIGNMMNIRIFSRNSFEEQQIAQSVKVSEDKSRHTQSYILKMRIVLDITVIVFMSSMMLGLIIMYRRSVVTPGDFAFIISLSTSMFLNLWWVTSQFVQFAQELGKCSQALTIITPPHEIADIKNAPPLQAVNGKIEFNQVTFHYNKKDNLFDHKTLVIGAGEKVGLVGFSGAGKSTFANLILRFFDVESGAIKIDGQDISKVTQESLRENISMIPQDTSLFHRSLMENIRYGRLDATDEEVVEASKRAYCHEFIHLLPEGYQSLVGERGIKLSGGQRQRIAIARAILKNAPILILDEATSALDSVTEKKIQQSLESLMEGCTTIVIAHRLSTLSQMDRILVFDKGRIIEDGTHDQLIDAEGHYAQMWGMQAGGFLPSSECY